MPWNDNGGNSQGPWGQGPRPPQPPDIEQVIKTAREKFAGGASGGGKLGLLVLLIAFVGWMSTGVYKVGADEQGVVMRFGRYVQSTGPGLHFHLPSPIESVTKVKVTQVQRIEIGYRTRGREVDVPQESLMLTGDENIIDIDMSVQYRIKNAADFLFKVRSNQAEPIRFSRRGRRAFVTQNRIVQNATESAIRQIIGNNSIDEALTVGKRQIQVSTKQTLQSILDSYQSGIEVIVVQLQQVAPPQEVVHAFKDVASAREDRERAINEAQGYANDILPKANGEAARMVQEAQAYKAGRVARSEGDVKRFQALLTEYSKAKNVTRTRLYLETMEEVLSNTRKVIMGNEGKSSQGVLPYLPLDRLGGTGAAATTGSRGVTR